jgi:hypothetical protein
MGGNPMSASDPKRTSANNYRFIVLVGLFPIFKSSSLMISTVLETESAPRTNRPPIFLKNARLSLLLLKRTTNLLDFSAKAISEAVPAPPAPHRARHSSN